MVRKFDIRIFAIAAGLLSFTGAALSQDAISAPAQKTIGGTKSKMVPSLAVLNSGGATLVNGKLTLTGVTPNSIVFADRPVTIGRACAHDRIHQGMGRGQGQFCSRPAERDDLGS